MSTAFHTCGPAGLLYSGSAAIALGDPNKGLGLIEKGLATNRVIGSAWGTAWYLIWQADARSKLGQHDLALELLAQAEALMVKTGERFMESQLFHSRGVLASNLGDAVATEYFLNGRLIFQSGRLNALISCEPRWLWRGSGGNMGSEWRHAISWPRFMGGSQKFSMHQF
jgi:hypothetical protein